jgi:hypothetical protein
LGAIPLSNKNNKESVMQLPYVNTDKSKLYVFNYSTGERLRGFVGLARDYAAERFVVVAAFGGHRKEVNYLVSESLEDAVHEAKYISAKLSLDLA